jgi:hypothetical protein
MNISYNPGVPNAPNDPSVDVVTMHSNASAINLWPLVDHKGFNDNLGGYHTNIHQPPTSPIPAAIAGPPKINQLFVQLVTPDTSPSSSSDTQLFSLTAGNILSQLTGSNIDTSTGQGYIWSSGALIQWGGSNLVGNQIVFQSRNPGKTIPFTKCFVVLPTLLANPSNLPNAAATISIYNVSPTSFNFQFVGDDTKYVGFQWIAIGI